MRAIAARHAARLWRTLALNSSGSAIIEMAFAAPLALAFMIGLFEAGRMLWLQNALNYSVAEAARCASNSPSKCGSAANTKSFAANQSGAGFDSSVFTVVSTSCGNQVSASYPMTLAVLSLNVSVTLTAQACYPV